MKGAEFLSTALICLLASAPAQASSLLERLAGEWRGIGLYSEISGNAPERASCRLEASIAGDGSKARMSGRCSTVSGAGWFRIMIDGGRDRQFAASFSYSAAPEVAGYRGRASGEHLIFESLEPLRIKNTRFHSRIVIHFEGNARFSMSQTLSPVSGGARRTLSDMTFAKRTVP